MIRFFILLISGLFLNSAIDANADYNENIINPLNHGLKGYFDNIRRIDKSTLKFANDKIQNGDTLFIGPGDDTLRIEDGWIYKGTVLIIGKGKIVFDNVKATIYGDIMLWGDEAELIAINSELFFPQEYFYQRRLMLVGGSKAKITDSKLDYHGLPHNLYVGDSASYILRNTRLNGFTTCGMQGRGRVDIIGCNETGEFILADEADLNFNNSKLILLWHLVDDGQKLNVKFPDGKEDVNYKINAKSEGIEGLKYQVEVANCDEVLWGLMPKKGSEIKIKDSKIRSIGLWFSGKDTTEVTGLVNKSKYSNFKADLDDRNLQFENCEVMTWSLYCFDQVNIKFSGCILGEVGSFGMSRVTGTNYLVDGTGGYLFSSDNSTFISSFASATCNVRSEKNSIMIFGYSAQTNGTITSIGSSVMIIAQSAAIEKPIILDHSSTWFANIAGPAVAEAGSVVSVIGSAWIDRTKTSPLMDFAKYYLSYQKNGDSIWTKIDQDRTEEVRDKELIMWNTKDVPPGVYNIKLSLVSTLGEEATVDAVKSINLLEDYVSVNDESKTTINVFPNPACYKIELSFDEKQILNVSKNTDLIILDNLGKIAINKKKYIDGMQLDISNLKSGIYYIIFGDIRSSFIKY